MSENNKNKTEERNANEGTIIREIIENEALKILEEYKEGIRFTDLKNKIHESTKKNENTIRGTIYNLHEKYPEKVSKPGRGLFILNKYLEESESNKERKTKNIREEDFYEPFRNWLIEDMEEVTKAIVLGGNYFGAGKRRGEGRWTTPDIIGVRKPKRSDIIETPIEVLSAEIKTDPNNLIMGLGQACAYKLFSHKVYLVIPKNIGQAMIQKIDSLCQINKIGLVVFDSSNKEEPNFSVMCRPIKTEPDPFYLNEYMKSLEAELFD